MLCIVGRLLKDRALGTVREARQTLYVEAADAYMRAAEINAATYPLINAATLSLLAGHEEQARDLAARVLDIGRHSVNEAETPYYQAATAAEAYLLLGDAVKAKASLKEAIARAPLAYEDHASTLRQFRLILDALGQERSWLETLRPPRCLHFAGHMQLAGDDEDLRKNVRKLIEEENIGFGFGALAAGADILIAEVLLEVGAELHVVLPTAPELFREVSVVPSGVEWVTRFDCVLVQATSVFVVDGDNPPLLPQILQLATEVAMGKAVMQAASLSTEAVQLVVLDRSPADDGVPGSSQWAHATWTASSRRQRVLIRPRVGDEGDADGYPVLDSTQCLVAVLRIAWPDADRDVRFAAIAEQLTHMLAFLRSPPVAVRWTGEALVVEFDTPALAAQAALLAVATLKGAVDIAAAGHYGVAERMNDPFGGPPLVAGRTAALPRHILSSTPPGAVYVTEEFAAALNAGPENDCPLAEYVGDMPEAEAGRSVRLFALSARPAT